MRILTIVGSPRGVVNGAEGRTIDLKRPGNVIEPVPVSSCSERLADAFIAGAESKGHECVKLTLHELSNISPCRACYGCVKTGKCVIQDDMQRIYPELDSAEAVVFVTPLYYATLPAQVLALVNRLYPYWIDGIRYPKLQGAGVIGTCADFGQSWDLYDRTWQSIFGEIGWKTLGILHAPRFMEHVDEQLAAARRFGESIIAG